MIAKINLADPFQRFDDYWHQRIAAELNDSYLKVVKLEDGEVRLGPGELVVIPPGVDHMPVAENEIRLVLLEPKTTTNTGSAGGERTVAAEWL